MLIGLMSIIFISCSVVASAESESKLFHIDLQSVVDELPKGWVDNLVKEMTGPGGPDGGDVIDDEDLEKYQNIFRFLDPRRSRVNHMLMKTGRKSDIFQSGQYLYQSSPNPGMKTWIKLIEDGISSNLEQLLLHPNLISNATDILSMMETFSTTTAADADTCHRDYASFVTPITGRIMGAVGDQVCAPLPGVLRFICTSIFSRHRNDAMPHGGLKMIDAMSKFPTGILDGRLAWVGAYDFCETRQHVTYNDSDGVGREFEGKYCRLHLKTKTTPSLPLQFGVCVPDTCDSANVSSYILRNPVLRVVLDVILNMELDEIFCGMEGLEPEKDAALIVALTICGIILAIVIAATIYDGFYRKRYMRKQVKLLTSGSISSTSNGSKSELRIRHRLELAFVGFSAYTNWRKIFTTRTKPGDILALDGFRFLSFVYILWGQTYVFGPLYSETWLTANLFGAIRRLVKKFTMQPVINYHLTQDSFLLISGILVTFWFLRRLEANGNRLTWKAIVYYILHRYWRLMPAMILGIMIFTCTYKYTADGPMFPSSDPDGEACRVNWWVDLLMVHNLVRVSEQCFGHAWFIPVIFQLHVAALVILIPLAIKAVAGYAVLFVVFLVHIGVTAGVSQSIRSEGDLGRWYDDYLVTPWCRAGPFLIGMAYGIIFYKRYTKGIKLRKIFSILMWLVSIGTILSVTFSPYSQYKEGGERWSESSLVAYDTLARSAWAVACGYMLLACHFGFGGVIKNILAWKVYTPVCRIIYTTLLMQGMFIYTWAYTARVPLFINTYYMLYALFGHLIYCTIVGLGIALMWHMPFAVGLEHALLYKTKLQWIKAGRHPHFDRKVSTSDDQKDVYMYTSDLREPPKLYNNSVTPDDTNAETPKSYDATYDNPAHNNVTPDYTKPSVSIDAIYDNADLQKGVPPDYINANPPVSHDTTYDNPAFHSSGEPDYLDAEQF